MEEFTWDEDILFLQSFFKDKQLQALADANDHVARSQSYEQPEGSLGEAVKEVKAGWVGGRDGGGNYEGSECWVGGWVGRREGGSKCELWCLMITAAVWCWSRKDC